jgi:hypothetical protein
VRFLGKVGYGQTEETESPGVYEDVITERTYSGDVTRKSRSLTEGEVLNQDLSVSHSISIVADEFARGNFMHIRYVEWAGKRWTVTEVEVQRPRLLLRLGEVYNGPGPIEPPESP